MKFTRLLTALLLTSPPLIHAQGFTDANWTDMGAGVNQPVRALAAEDGFVYAGGDFTTAGVEAANHIAYWDGYDWYALDGGLNGMVRALVVRGWDLYAGGDFTTAGGVPANGIAKWDDGAEEWSALGSGVDGTVSALAVSGGDVFAAGTFTTAGGVTVNRIAKWNGTAWSALGSGCDAAVTALAVKSGELYAGGAFTTAGGVPANRIAKWNGTTWSALGAGISGGNVAALALKQGTVFAGGDFPGGVAQWNGSAWSVPGAGVGGGSVSALIVHGSDLYAGGNFLTAGGAPANRMAKWDGSAWSPLGSGVDGSVLALTKDTSGFLTAGGAFTTAGTTPAAHVAQADVGQLPVPEVTAISPSSGLYTGGTVVTITGSNFSLVEHVWFGDAEAASFTIVSDTQIIATTAPVSDTGAEEGVYVTSDGGASDSGAQYFQFWGIPLVQAGTGKLLPTATSFEIAGDRFSSVPGENTVVFSPSGKGTVVPGNPRSYVTVTNVTGLTPGPLYAVITTRGLSSGAPVQVATVAAATPGDVAAPDFGLNGSVVSMATQPDGKIIVAGDFTEAGGVPRRGLARFYPGGVELDTSFDPNPVNGTVLCVAVQQDGMILVGGTFTALQPRKQGAVITRNRIARLTEFGFVDAAFDPNANSSVLGLVEQEDRRVLLYGAFTTLQPNGAAAATTRKYIARVDYFGRLEENFDPGANNIVRCALPLPDGSVVFGGQFTAVQPNAGAVVTRNRLARVNPDGTLDAGFDPNVQTTGFVSALAMQPDGRLLVGGEFSALQPNGAATATARKGLARLNADGTLDAGFNPNPDRAFLTGLALQADGRIIVCGQFSTLQPNGAASAIARNRVARLNADGSVDMAFDPNAIDVHTAMLEADGRVLIGGRFSRLKPNGASDQTSTRRQGLARLVNDPATQTISITPAATVLWQRGGSAPEVSVVEIDRALSPTSGWGPPSRATRVGTTSNWELAGMHLGTYGILRARGRLASGGPFVGSIFMEQLFTYPPVVDVTVAVAGYAASFGLTGADAAPGAMPFGDGVPNLLKYAFNIPLNGPNVTQLTPGSGTGGLPAFSMPPLAPGAPPVIRLEFVRRRNSPLIYTPKRSTQLGSFTPLNSTPAVTVIDADWERVVYNEPAGTPAPSSLFCFVEVAAP